jgi:nucleotide-binding universal stress UspA family protein
MKIRPADKSKRGVLVELGPGETRLHDESTTPEFDPLALFKINRILVPVDFSGCSRKAVQYALPFAKAFDATITLLHVVEPFVPVPEMAGVDVAMITRQLREDGERQLASLRQEVGESAVVETVLRVGRAETEILHAASELGSDLIILSTHGRTGLAHVFMGSTAEHIVRRAACPVLVVRENEHEFIRANPQLAATARERSQV